MEVDIDGVLVGHWTNRLARTGCTVIRLPAGAVASGEIRGGAPATREFALLDPVRTVQHVDAVVLSGGSAFGLSTADGVVAELEAEGRGFPTAAGPVPIVVAMGLYDLAEGSRSVRPGPDEGGTAYRSAADGFEVGQVGAGTGATTNKWSGSPEPGGLGAACTRSGPVRVMAIMAVNAVGAIDLGVGRTGSGSPADPGPPAPVSLGENTTIGVVLTNVGLDKMACHLMAQAAHDGLARALLPAHTPFDGDAVVVVSTGEVEADTTHLRLLVQQATEQAVRSLRAGGSDRRA